MIIRLLPADIVFQAARRMRSFTGVRARGTQDQERNMKKITGFAAAIILILTLLSACGWSTADNDDGQKLPEIKIGGVIYAPYFYRNIDGDYDGIDVRLAREACSRMGYSPVFADYKVGTQLAMLESGAVECIWSCVSMDEYGGDGENSRYMWAGPYLYSQRVVMVKNDSDIQTLDDLNGRRVGVQTGSASEKVILQGMKDKDGIFSGIKQLTVLDSLGQVFTALKKGYVDAIAGHESALNIYAEDYPGQYRCLNMTIRRERLGVAFRKDGDAELAHELKKTLDEMTADGTTEGIIKDYGLDVERNLYGGPDDGTAES